ncbi:MAG: hypothetical protein ABI867_03295 [Kofleriaceae bacterium]
MRDAVTFGWIRDAEAGVVDRLGSERVATEFFCFIIPVVARGSYYAYANRDGEACTFDIPRDRRSVFLGYTRTPLWLLACFFATPALFDFARWKYLLVIATLLAATAAVLTFAMGKLSPGERERREMLKRITGLGAPPELMPADMLDQIREDLSDEWFHRTDTPWRDSIRRGEADETLVVLAEYYREPQLAIRARTNLIDSEGN